MGALEASRDMETGQEASRAAPVPGPTVEQGARASMAGEGIRAAMVSPPPRKGNLSSNNIYSSKR